MLQATGRVQDQPLKPHTYFWAPYAAVSREWQLTFERRTFASLALFNDDVESFCAAVTRYANRLEYVGRLRLTIDLPTYTCDDCGTDEDAATIERNNIVFTAVLWRLLSGLAAWEGPGPDCRNQNNARGHAVRGIQLELGVRSPSDGQHALQDYRIRYPYGRISSWRTMLRYHSITNPQRGLCKHGWKPWRVGGELHRNRAIPLAAHRRLFGTRPLAFDAEGVATGMEAATCSGNLALRYQTRRDPPVSAIVRKLVLGRRFYRAVHPDTLYHLLHICLPSVQEVHLEPWRPLDAVSFDIMERGYRMLLADLPPSLRCLTIFLENDRIFHPEDRRADGSAVGPSDLIFQRPSHRIGRRLAKGSNQLAVINVAFLVEAADFFSTVACLPTETHTWPQLTTLILTSAMLTPTAAFAAVEQVLLAAATAAQRMPKLSEFELWNASQRKACRFSVTLPPKASTSEDGRGPNVHLKLSSTWPLEAVLTEEVVRAWQKVAQLWLSRDYGESTWADERCLVVESEIWDEGYRYVLNGRSLVLESDMLVIKHMFQQSLLDRTMEYYANPI